jgi:ligand-binding SRPBCC domain-containing protein
VAFAYPRGMPRIALETFLAASPSRCFGLSLTVDAHTSSMAASGERAIGGVTTGVMTLGDEVTWRARHLGLWFEMTSRITAHDAPHRFVDEQVRGPFRRWWHEHVFDAAPDGTVMRDVVEYSSPAGPLGRLAEALVLTRYLTDLLERRNRWLADHLAGSAGPPR